MRQRLPKLRIVPIENTGTPLRHCFEQRQRIVHRDVIVSGFGKVQRLKRTAEIASIRRKNYLTAGEANTQLLMPRRVAKCRDANNTPIAEHIMFAIDQNDVLPECIVVG